MSGIEPELIMPQTIVLPLNYIQLGRGEIKHNNLSILLNEIKFIIINNFN